MNPREMTLADLAAQPVEIDRIAQLETALDDIRDACGREGSTMTPSEVSQLAVERIATLEHQARYCADETKQAVAELATERERNASLAAWALIVKRVKARLTTTRECPQWTWVDFNYMVDDIRGLLSECDLQAILAAHDAEVERKAKVEALEEVEKWIHPGGHPMVTLECIHDRIAALAAEGGRG